jgi:DNA replication protein DnaC
MSFKSLYKEVIRELDTSRNEADVLLKKRKNEIYNLIPEMQEIDDKIRIHGMNKLRDVFNSTENKKHLILLIREETEILLNRKKSLLMEYGMKEDYLNDVFKCKQCSDTGYISNEKCVCLKQKLINKYYSVSNLSHILEEENFDTFDFRYYSNDIDKNAGISPHENVKMIYGSCLNFIKHFNTKFTNLLFYGDTGLGKTFLCNCIAKDLLDIGKSVLYVTAPRLFKKIEDKRFNKDAYADSSYDELEMVFECDVLIIDDLGTEFGTIVTSSELFNIINTRLLNRKPTIISSNLSLKSLQDSYSDRIISRFYGRFKMMKLYGDDIRVKKKLGIKNT